MASCINIVDPKIYDSEVDPRAFRDAVVADLESIYGTPTGKQMLESLAKSGKKVTVQHHSFGNAIGGYDAPNGRFLRADGTPGAGTNSKIAYNPGQGSIGLEPWDTRPPAIGLAHELVHAEQAAYGRMREGKAPNGPVPKPPHSQASNETDIRELEAVGIPPFDDYPFSENKLRAEWRPPQTRREWY